MKLRRWQNECVDQALTTYATNQAHFLCLATPGAGKTVMASELAAQLFGTGQIDFVLCFAPSVSVVSGFITTFERRLNKRMDGKIGAAGGAYTYQAMMHLGDDFWLLLKHYRVLVVFDEIHHCSGFELDTANAWGETILLQIRDKAKFSLAMTGTPWRSDDAPIVMARYLDPDARLHCDYVYGLRNAVTDDVCRKPVVTLIDASSVKVAGETFKSLAKALSLSDLEYSAVLHEPNAMTYALELGVNQLNLCRKSMPNAGGLIVASSIAHAKQLKQILCNQLNQSAVIVTYKEHEPQRVINSFKVTNTQWIVSVGMVSEGTDIPRLQVCCHLSTVRTELYFRQILGRVLRKISGIDNEFGYLITFAEESLLTYAERILQEVPESEVRLKTNEYEKPEPTQGRANAEVPVTGSKSADKKAETPFGFAESQVDHSIDFGNEPKDFLSWSFNGVFRQKVISVFSQPFV